MTDETVDQDAVADEWEAALAEQGDEDGAAVDPDELLAEASAPADENPNDSLEKAQPQTLNDDSLPSPDGDENLDMILDIPVTLSVRIGTTKISIRNLLKLNQGSVVELDRMAGEPMDLIVNDTLVAHGEVVVVNEKFGIRLTDVISAQDRVMKLK